MGSCCQNPGTWQLPAIAAFHTRRNPLIFDPTVSRPMGSKKHPRLRLWIKRLGLGLLVVIVLLLVFHRPIIFEGTRYFVVRAAKQQNLDIDYEIGGSIFSTLTVSNLKATPTEPGPIQRLEIGNIDLQYSLWGALRNGLPALLDLVALKNVYVEITPSEEPPPEKKEEPQAFKFPALFPKTLQIENVNFVSHAKTGDTVVEDFWFTLLPDKPGVLKVQTLDIPGVRKWTDISGNTTFRDRNLLLTDFHIGREIRLARFNLDASKLDEQQMGIGLEGALFEAPISLDVKIADLNATNDLTAKLSLESLEFQRVWDYLNLKVPATGRLGIATIDFAGKPEQPKTWKGNVAVRLSGLAASGQKIGDVSLDADIADGRAEVQLADDLGAKNDLSLSLKSELPEKLEGFVDTRADGILSLNLSDLAALTASLPEPVEGDAAGRIDFRLQGGVFEAAGEIKVGSLVASGARVYGTKVQLSARKNLRVKDGSPPFEGASAALDVNVDEVRFQDYTVDALRAAANVDGALVTLREFSIFRGTNGVVVSGSYTLPADMKSYVTQPWKADVEVKAPALDEFIAQGAETRLSGSLNVAGTARSDGKAITGNFDITGRDVAFNGLTVPTIDGKLAVGDNLARLDNLAIVINEDNTIRASGEVGLAEPYRYEGSLDVNLGDLSVFNPLSPEQLAGTLTAQWSGGGDAQKKEHSGDGKVVLTNGQFGGQAGLNAEVQANYTPEMIDVPVLQATAEMGGISTKVHWEKNQLAVTDLNAQLKKLTVLRGSLSLPLDLSHLDNVDLLIPNDGTVSIALETPKLKLSDVFAQLGTDPSPASGMVSAKISASGTIAELSADVSVRADEIKAAAAAEMKPANVALDLSVRNDRLAIDGKITQPRINPVLITGGLPLDVEKIKREKTLPPDTPLKLSLKMADSPLDFVASLVPMIRFIDGHAGIDVEVSGTTSRPQFAGTVEADIKHLRLNNEGLPPVTNVAVRIDSTTERLRISQFRGDIAGGVFGAEGTVDFSKPENPMFDLAFGSRDALVMQDEAMTVRISSRVTVKGPLEAATVGGNVYVTRSRFFKNIDILPIGLPGRPAPQPPEAPSVPGVTDPPLRNWKFDIDIKTADPFLVRSNLADGRITIDLHLGGTGMEPWVDGNVRIEQLRTSLPFSTLEIDNGLVYFTKDEPFIPQFDIRGTSQIRDYNVSAYIFGDMTNPQATFTSNPPLPQTEIIALIATGVTSKELAGNPSVLAGKAAMLLFQKLYRSVFKRNSSEPPKDTLLSRIDFDVGTTDPKTGRQAASVRFPLNDNIVLVGGLDVGGNFRGQVKYLIRFR
jgi:TamB, inner membrane protein subunit of TAM complex